MIISIANNKGGVAKTTSTVNLAAALAKQKKKVLLIDFDSQSSLTIYVGIEPIDLKFSAYDFLMDKCSFDDVKITLSDRIDIIPSSIDLSIAEVELMARIGRESVLKRKLEDVKGYDYILIDNGPSFGILTINSLTASDYIIAPCKPEYLALRGLEILTSCINQVKLINPDLKLMGVLITLFNSVTIHHSEVTNAIKNKYPTFESVIKHSVKLADACIAKKSIMDFAGMRFQGSKAYMNLAKEVIEIGKES